MPAISGFILSRLKRVPFILEIRDLCPESIVELGVMKKNNYIIKSLYAIAKYIYQKSELIVVVTETFKSYLINLGIKSDKIIIIENRVGSITIKEEGIALNNADFMGKIKVKNIKSGKIIISDIETGLYVFNFAPSRESL